MKAGKGALPDDKSFRYRQGHAEARSVGSSSSRDRCMVEPDSTFCSCTSFSRAERTVFRKRYSGTPSHH